MIFCPESPEEQAVCPRLVQTTYGRKAESATENRRKYKQHAAWMDAATITTQERKKSRNAKRYQEGYFNLHVL